MRTTATSPLAAVEPITVFACAWGARQRVRGAPKAAHKAAYLTCGSVTLRGDFVIARFIARLAPGGVYASADPIAATEIDQWLDFVNFKVCVHRGHVACCFLGLEHKMCFRVLRIACHVAKRRPWRSAPARTARRRRPRSTASWQRWTRTWAARECCPAALPGLWNLPEGGGAADAPHRYT